MVEPRTCSVDGCVRDAITRGWCSTHYGRWLRSGDPGPAVVAKNGRATAGPAICVIEDCQQRVRVKSRGWCNKHYRRWQKFGDPQATAPLKGSPSPKRKWMGAHGLTGYSYHGCRCDICREAKAAASRAEKEALQGDPRTPHGTLRGYQTWGCRCDDCRGAMRQYQSQEQVARRRAEAVKASRLRLSQASPSEHGASTYSNRGCRCETCTSAFLEMNAKRVEEDRRQQGAARKSASREIWAGPDLELILLRDDLNDRALARMTGRTVAAVRTARWKARRDPKWAKVAGVDDA